MKNKISKKNNLGFTLIEIIVVIAVFLLIVGTSVTIFVYLVRDQKRILAKQEIMNQVSYIIEKTGKALRMAKIDEDGSCLGEGYENYVYRLTHFESGVYRGVKFVNQTNNDACEEYYLLDSVFYQKINSQEPVPLSSNKFEVSNLRFIINGDTTLSQVGLQNYYQPRVTIYFQMGQTSGSSLVQTVQTTVSQRNLNTIDAEQGI